MTTKQIAVLAAAVVIVVGVAALLTHRRPAPGKLSTPAPIAGLAAPPASCLLPGPPPVPPNGAAANADEMRLGHDVMQAFVVQLEAYQSCRDAQADHGAPSVPKAQRDQWIAEGDDAIDQANALAASFGQQLKVFKARQAR